MDEKRLEQIEAVAMDKYERVVVEELIAEIRRLRAAGVVLAMHAFWSGVPRGFSSSDFDDVWGACEVFGVQD